MGGLPSNDCRGRVRRCPPRTGTDNRLWPFGRSPFPVGHRYRRRCSCGVVDRYAAQHTRRFRLGESLDNPRDCHRCVLLLVSIPTLQWIVLRGVATRSLRWVPINAGAWAVGIMWTLAPSPFIDERTPASVLFASYVVAGLMMALTVAALTGSAARRIAMTAKDHDGIPASG